MYLNTKLVNRMEEMCNKKEIPYFRNRMFNRGFFGFGHYGCHIDEMDQEDDSFNKKYNLSKIKDHIDLEICLGSEFLNMDLSMLDTKNKKNDSEAFLNLEDDDFFMKGMLNRYRGKDKQELANGFEFKFMIFERNLQITLHNMQEFFIFQDMLNCSPLINEWLTFAKKHKIKIDHELKDIVSFIEKDKGGFKLYENLMAEFSPLKRAAFNLMKKSQSLMRNSHGNRMFYHPNHREEEATDSQLKYIEIELIKEMDELDFTMKAFIKKIKDVKQSINNDYFNEVDVLHNNNLLIEGLFAAYQKLKHKIVLPKTRAKSFIDDSKSEKYCSVSPEKLIEHYNDHILFVGENIKSENERYQKVILFTDSTCVVLANDQSEFEVFVNIKTFKNLVKSCMIAYLKSVLHKNPSIAKMIGQTFSDIIGSVDNNVDSRHHHNSFHFNKILSSIDTYFKHENILKSLKYDFMEKCKKATCFEKIDDEMHKLIREHKIKKFAESIISSKYKHLYNKESYKLFQELYDLSIDTKTLQEMLGKKLAAVENKKTFNENIKKLINNLNEFDMESVKLKANAHSVKIISEEKEILILEIENFIQSQKLGSASWCISRNQSYFEQYTEKGGKQYFIYDFNQDSKNIKSLLGITLTKAFKVKAAHTKSDSQFKDKEMIDYLIEKVKPIEVEKEKKPVATRKPRTKKVVTAPDIAIPNIGF